MFQPSRRSLLAGASALIPASLLLEGCTPSFTQVQGYVATAIAALDKLGPIIATIDPAASAQLSKIIADANAAAAAFAALTSPGSGATTAQTVVTLIEDGLAVAASVPGLPPTTAAIITAVELLLVTVAGFFNLTAPQPKAELAPAVLSLRQAALARYNAASDKRHLADDAQSQIQSWLAAA